MADPKEPNSLPYPTATPPSAPSSASTPSSPDLDPITLEKTTSHPRSRAESDPLSPLEEALASPDQETPYERLARQRSAASSQHHHPLSRAQTGTTSIAFRPPDFEIVFGDSPDDPWNPKTWPLWPRAWIIFLCELLDVGGGAVQHELHGIHTGADGRV